MIRYVLKQITKEGLWTSPDVFEAPTKHNVNMAVIAGFLGGQARWAETPEGVFLFGFDAKGNEIQAAPAAALRDALGIVDKAVPR